ncbi:MAG: peptidylprolyl isomerase [Chloroflexaceae bacterium]|nr:peptidylprolyl isomerase [Chloroflexaceae bacterium]
MSQPNRPKSGPPQPPNLLPGIISAVVVLLVLGLLGVFLASRPLGNQPTASQPAGGTPGAAAGFDQTPGAAVPTPPAADVAPTAPAAPAAGGIAPEVAARNDKYSALPPMTIDATKTYTATITTPRGDIVIRLRPDLAPQTVNSFVFLAREGFYDGTTWHRVLPGFVAQGGDPTGTGMGGPGYDVPAEFTDKVLYDKPGIVAMARAQDPNSGGSQFFITLAPTPSLNNQYTIFGEVVSGQEIVEGIPERDPQMNPNAPPGEQMLTVTISEG